MKFLLLTVACFLLAARAECLPLYRGAQTGDVSAEAMSALRAAGASIVRIQIGPAYGDTNARSNPDLYHQSVVTSLDAANFISDAVNVLDLHQAPLLSDGKIDVNTLIKEWQYITERFKDSSTFFVFGILNEPELPKSKDAHSLMTKVLKAIRAIDKKRVVLVTTSYADPQRYATFKKFRDSKIWYELHMFYPMNVTHQRIAPFPELKTYSGSKKEKAALVRYLKNARAFQVKNKVPMFVGEFGISALADPTSRKKYLNDLISIFAKYKWSWTYHAWREAPAWDIESDPALLQLMKAAWSKNK